MAGKRYRECSSSPILHKVELVATFWKCWWTNQRRNWFNSSRQREIKSVLGISWAVVTSWELTEHKTKIPHWHGTAAVKGPRWTTPPRPPPKPSPPPAASLFLQKGQEASPLLRPQRRAGRSGRSSCRRLTRRTGSCAYVPSTPKKYLCFRAQSRD